MSRWRGWVHLIGKYQKNGLSEAQKHRTKEQRHSDHWCHLCPRDISDILRMYLSWIKLERNWKRDFLVSQSLWVALPRRDCQTARKRYLSFAKSKKHSAKQIRKALKKQISYVKRNIGYLEGFMSAGLSPRQKDIPTILTIFKLYEQQKYMYDNKAHKVENRIVSISQP